MCMMCAIRLTESEHHYIYEYIKKNVLQMPISCFKGFYREAQQKRELRKLIMNIRQHFMLSLLEADAVNHFVRLDY